MTFAIFLATKEVALPGEVYESLLSQSCDASEVVLQMRHNLQLEQASLEHPDAETKTLIRCLARTAKDSKRLDVFEHLRKILPAGTTGKLVFAMHRAINGCYCSYQHLDIKTRRKNQLYGHMPS